MYFVFLIVVKVLKDNPPTPGAWSRKGLDWVSFPIFLIVSIFYLKRSCYVWKS